MDSKSSCVRLKEVTTPPQAGLKLMEAIRAHYKVDLVPSLILPDSGDRRRNPRFECVDHMIQAILRSPDGEDEPCLMTDFSAYGARLVVERKSRRIGDQITLVVPMPDGTQILCSAAIRSRFLDDFLGVTFLD
jgi:hypothetical protein